MNNRNPGSATKSVWNYSRPPRLESTDKHIIVVFDGKIIADTQRAYRLLETSHPPNYYIPPDDIRIDYLIPSSLRTLCEFKGQAYYWSLLSNHRLSENAAWYYPHPASGYGKIKDFVSFYPSRAEACYVNGERVIPQSGDFYGGWITNDIRC